MNCENCGQEMSHHYYSYYNSDANQCDIEIVECANCQIEEPAELAALREAGEKMAEILRKDLEQYGASSVIFYAIQEWEAANK